MTRMTLTTKPEPRRPELDVDMRTTLAGVGFTNPIMTASGCAASGRELHQFFDVARLGAVVTKSVMLAPRSGRATPRMAETPSGMLNSIGLQGPVSTHSSTVTWPGCAITTRAPSCRSLGRASMSTPASRPSSATPPV